MKYHAQWLIRSHMKTLMAMEQIASDAPWTERELVQALRKRSAIGSVAIDLEYENLFGYSVMELNKDRIHIVRLCIDPAMRRQGVAKFLIDRMKDKLTNQRRRYLTADVHESQLAVQLTLAHCGFVATGMDGELIRFEFQTAASLQAVREDGCGEWTT